MSIYVYFSAGQTQLIKTANTAIEVPGDGNKPCSVMFVTGTSNNPGATVAHFYTPGLAGWAEQGSVSLEASSSS